MSPAPTAATSSALPPPPPRPMRPVSPGNLQLAEFATKHHVVTVPAGVPLEHITDPAWWANVADRLRPCDKIDVHDAAGRYYLELIVRHVTAGRVVSGARGGAIVFPLRFIEFEPLEAKPAPITHEIRFLGPVQGWCIIRIHDQRVVSENLPDREAAEKHLAGMVKTGLA
jgi:hypothetical protein